MSRNKVLEMAEAQVGGREDPPGSNRQKYGEAYGVNGVPWCIQFLWWIFAQSGESGAFYGGKKTASAGELLRWAKKAGRTKPPAQITRGDLVILCFDGSGDTQHGGIVMSPQGYTFITIEGNTSATSEDNGGAVCVKTRNLSQVVGVIDPLYLPEDVAPSAWYAEDVRFCIERGYMSGYPDGSFNPAQGVSRAEIARLIRRLHEE